jgi:hypothetical protein
MCAHTPLCEPAYCDLACPSVCGMCQKGANRNRVLQLSALL